MESEFKDCVLVGLLGLLGLLGVPFVFFSMQPMVICFWPDLLHPRECDCVLRCSGWYVGLAALDV